MAKTERELTYVPAASQAHIDGFIEMLWLEKRVIRAYTAKLSHRPH